MDFKFTGVGALFLFFNDIFLLSYKYWSPICLKSFPLLSIDFLDGFDGFDGF